MGHTHSKQVLTFSLACSNCLTTTESASSNTLVTELNKLRAALTTAERSFLEFSNAVSHKFSITAPAHDKGRKRKPLLFKADVKHKVISFLKPGHKVLSVSRHFRGRWSEIGSSVVGSTTRNNENNQLLFSSHAKSESFTRNFPHDLRPNGAGAGLLTREIINKLRLFAEWKAAKGGKLSRN